MSQRHPPTDRTKARLLEAAGRVFAERGFEHATVREICRRATANVASVNYYFRDKAGLYEEVLTYGAQQGLDAFPPDLGLGARPSLEEQLHAFIYSFLCRFLDAGQRANWYSNLCAREMVTPTKALDRVVREIIRPLSERLETIVRRLAPKASANDVRRCAMSIVGQCLFYYHSRAVIKRLHGSQHYTQAQIQRLAEHITQFSLAGLRTQRATKEYAHG